jgi:hypothetical protein
VALHAHLTAIYFKKYYMSVQGVYTVQKVCRVDVYQASGLSGGSKRDGKTTFGPVITTTALQLSNMFGLGGRMSFVTTQPEALAAAANNMQNIGCAVSTGSTAAAIPTTAVIPAAADEVSALTALQFAAHGQLYLQ